MKMMNSRNGFVLIMMLVGFTSCAQSSNVLDANEFEKKMAATKEKTILDVRTPGEFSEGHLTNAKNIDYYNDDFKQQVSKLDKNKPVFVYCKAGGRSASAKEVLTELGFTKIFDLQGGMNAWKQANKPVTK